MDELYNRVVVVIPTYNERENIRKLLLVTSRLYPGMRVFVVDDSSPDGTAEVVSALSRSYPHIRLLLRDSKEGMASAYLDAFARLIPDPSAEYIVTMDADWSHHPVHLSELLSHIHQHDVVIGSRYLPGGRVENWAWWRKFISKYGNLYTRSILGVPVFDLTAGFVAYRRQILAQVLPHITPRHPYAYQTEMKYHAYRAGAKIKEVPITFRERASGKSKFKSQAIFESFVFPWYLRFFK